MAEPITEGIPFKKGQIIRFTDDLMDGEELLIKKGCIFEVDEDTHWIKEFNCWSSVTFINFPCYVFTHKGLPFEFIKE